MAGGKNDRQNVGSGKCWKRRAIDDRQRKKSQRSPMAEERRSAMSTVRFDGLDENIHHTQAAGTASSRNLKFNHTNHIKSQQRIHELLSLFSVIGGRTNFQQTLPEDDIPLSQVCQPACNDPSPAPPLGRLLPKDELSFSFVISVFIVLSRKPRAPYATGRSLIGTRLSCRRT